MADFQVKICEKFNINSLTDNQSKSITAIIDGKEVKMSRADRNPWLAKMRFMKRKRKF
jgi:uncharacterized alpha/beta hydrolase family protein